MPYSKDKLQDLPDSTKGLTKRQKERFVDIFNSLVDKGLKESEAIPLAIKQSKTIKKSTEFLKATTADVTRDSAGNLVYRGQKFAGYNKPMSDSGNKQGKVLAKKGDEIKIVRFGDQNLKDNQTAEQNDRFYDRFGNQEGLDDPFSPLYWSARWLWPKGNLKGKGPKPFHTLKKSSEAVPVIKAFDEEQMISIEMVYEPYVLDAHNQWMSPTTLRKACEDFNEKLREGKVLPNLFHIASTDKFEIVKSWINEVECKIGDKLVSEGSWLAKLKFHDKELWEMHKSGETGGVSIGAQGVILPPKQVKEDD